MEPFCFKYKSATQVVGGTFPTGGVGNPKQTLCDVKVCFLFVLCGVANLKLCFQS